MISKLQTKENNKREKKDVITAYVWTIFTSIWLIFISICSYYFLMDDNPIKDTILIIIIINIPTFICIPITIITSYVDKFVRYTEFKTYSYERWNNIDNKYDTLYIIDEVKQYSKFLLNMHLYDYVEYKTNNEIEQYCNRLGSYTFKGYETKQEAMKSILNTVKNIVSEEKQKINVKVRNINSIDTYTINELKMML